MLNEDVTDETSRVVLAHGGGGQMMRQLIAGHILPRLDNSLLGPLDDGAVLPPASGRTVFTTDAFVVQPLTFPGGDIGRYAERSTTWRPWERPHGPSRSLW